MNEFKSYWYITNQLYHYPTLKAAKNDILMNFRPFERRKYLHGQCIDHIENNSLKSSVRISVDKKGSVTFSRPQLL